MGKHNHEIVPVEVQAFALLITKKVFSPTQVTLYCKREVIGSQETEEKVLLLCETDLHFVCQMIPGTGWYALYPKKDFTRWFEESWEGMLVGADKRLDTLLDQKMEQAEEDKRERKKKKEELINMIAGDLRRIKRNG